MNLSLLQNKHIRLALGISVGFLILILLLSPHASNPQIVPPPLPSPFRPELQSLSSTQRSTVAAYRATITDKLPIYQDNISTSVKLKTTLNLYILPSDPAETVRFEIYGVSYLNRDSTEFTNPNLTAFKETFQKGLALLREQGIDPTQLIFIYGDKAYVRETAEFWIKNYQLLP
ncbi:MAG: hypothetical protein UX38_C0001G0038 [Microgenomates group bacterium GW2011_GWC1_46_16]|uniref:Uncharacterized protein n=3 Tax=Microgenomates group TaxID=1794810 RepID=A0A1F5G0N7_9BACT|nr:MAG: hypothetical protein UX32_C0004G0019 [Microgenomates group bacterium GW2011_GWF1_46_12]KKU27038.1 MAG: hypothetical protein UX38_C0001G0038 [Microgenomates group bacterium GW2011_GWC1_46_16]KKU27920.1 MAG: hypothetical protein UX40_C0005G0073 [Microgenomates group bacterium GW2011_GWF2_46_18]KKU44322.1 MAG: hypothetical protein UX59_C0001G0041 [Microgenomates group bacterium GW2011_GWA1_46_7]KKU45324.1 MAG: hypothetical protein UX63_C0008G0034 [Microgenomates group bacterium GW2011_GWB1